MSESPARASSRPSPSSGSPLSPAWTTPDRNNNSVSSAEEVEGANAALGAMNLMEASPNTFSPFDFRNTRTPEEMALFDRFGDDYQDVVAAMDAEEQHDLKRAIKFEVPNNPTVSATCQVVYLTELGSNCEQSPC